MTSRYIAEYIPEDGDKNAFDKDGEFVPDWIEYKTVIGTDLTSVIAEAKRLNHPCNQECYFVRQEEYNEEYFEWEIIQRFSCDGESLFDD